MIAISFDRVSESILFGIVHTLAHKTNKYSD